MATEDGGPAFPSLEVYEGYDRERQDYVVKSDVATGMTLRDYFAAKAIEGLLSSYTGPDMKLPGADEAARSVYCYADAMLRERSK